MHINQRRTMLHCQSWRLPSCPLSIIWRKKDKSTNQTCYRVIMGP